ncbi:hypothetical protein WI211_01260 [Salmonella enterica subsp. enterica serovar Infantis]
MKDKGQMRGIAAFVATNPGCFCHEVIAGTGIQKFSVTSALIKLVKRGTYGGLAIQSITGTSWPPRLK